MLRRLPTDVPDRKPSDFASFLGNVAILAFVLFLIAVMALVVVAGVHFLVKYW